MTEVAKNFIKQFHKLSGETVKEKHQQLFRLLHQHKTLLKDPKDVAFIAANLKPTNHLETILRIDFLIYYKCFMDLYEEFKKGNEIVTSKLAKQDWFYQKAFKDVTCEEFVSDILPSSSHSLKLKILKKLPVSEDQADEFFDAVCKRYGVFLATVLLPKCSSSKIREALTTNPIQLTVAQLKRVFDKDCDLIDVYLGERVKHNENSNFMDNNPIFTYIAQRNPEVFSKLFDKYKFNTRLGRRTTKNYIDSQKNVIGDNVSKYVKVLSNNVAVRMLGSEMKTILFKENSDGGRFWQSLLKHYPKKQQFDVYKTEYNSFYHEKFGDNINTIAHEHIKLMTNPEEREKLAKVLIEKEDDISYLKFMTPNYCFKEMMDHINYSTSGDRIKYMEYGTWCCLFNDDVTNLLKICELVAVRLKNDEAAIRRAFIDSLVEFKKKLNILEERHWKYVFEVLATVKTKCEWCFGEYHLISEYVKYLVKNEKSLKELIEKEIYWHNVFAFSDLDKDKKAFKAFLLEFVESGVTKREKDEENYAARFDCFLGFFCKQYNKKNPDDLIPYSHNKRVLESVKEMVNSDESLYLSREELAGISYVVSQWSSSEDIKDLKKSYFENFAKVGSISALYWFLKHEPKTLVDNFDNFLSNFPKTHGVNTRRFWKLIKKCSYLGLDKRTVEFCKQKLTEEGYENKVNLVRALTILSSPKSHLEFIKQYRPVSDKVDLTDDDVKELYLVQGKVVSLLYYVGSPLEVLEATFEFCRGDYLQFALSPLYSCMCKVPESQTKEFVNKLNNTKALSVRKHGMNISRVIYDSETVYKCLSTGAVLSPIATLKYFNRNPSAKLWTVVDTQLNDLEKNQLLLIKEVLKLKIPFRYKNKLVETIWKVLDKHESKEWKRKLLPTIYKKIIPNFNPEFAHNVIRNNLFNLEEAHSFIANLLIYLNTDENFTLLSKIFSAFKQKYWTDPHALRTARRKFNSFVTDLFTAYMEAEEPNQKFVSDLTAVFESNFSLTEAFEEIVTIKCMALKGGNIESSRKVLFDLNETLTRQYGTFAVDLLADTLHRNVINSVFDKDGKKIKFCHSLLKFNRGVNDYLLILRLLPQTEPEDEEHFVLYEGIVKELTQVGDSVVQVQLNLYLKGSPNANTNVDWNMSIED